MRAYRVFGQEVGRIDTTKDWRLWKTARMLTENNDVTDCDEQQTTPFCERDNDVIDKEVQQGTFCGGARGGGMRRWWDETATGWGRW